VRDIGHLEGILGNRAMRLRFLDLEPDEVFEQAQEGDARCGEFVKLFHRALAAATATSIHLDGPGKFFIAGLNAEFVDLELLGGVSEGDGGDELAGGERVRDCS